MTECPSGAEPAIHPGSKQALAAAPLHQYASLGDQAPLVNTGVDGGVFRGAYARPVLFTQSAHPSKQSSGISSRRRSSSSGSTVLTEAALGTYNSNSHKAQVLISSGTQFAAQYNCAGVHTAERHTSPAGSSSDSNHSESLLLQQNVLQCSRCHGTECLCSDLSSASGCVESIVTPRQLSAPPSMSSLHVSSSSGLIAVHGTGTQTTASPATFTLATDSTLNPISYNNSSNSLYRNKDKYQRSSPGCSNYSMRSMPSNRQQYKQQMQNPRRRYASNCGAEKNYSGHRGRDDRGGGARRNAHRHGEHGHHTSHCRAIVKLTILAFMLVTTSGIFYGNNAAKELWRDAESLHEPAPLVIKSPTVSFADSLHSIENAYAQHRIMQVVENGNNDGSANSTSGVMEHNVLPNDGADVIAEANNVGGELPQQRMLSVVVQSEQDRTNELQAVSGLAGGPATAKDINISSVAATPDEYSGSNVDVSNSVVDVKQIPSATMIMKGANPPPGVDGVSDEREPSDDLAPSENNVEKPLTTTTTAMAAGAVLHQGAMETAVNLKQLQSNYPVELPKIQENIQDAKHGTKRTSTVNEVDLAQAIKLYQTADFFGLAICGWVLDRFGPRMTEMGAQVICSIGFFLYGCGWLKFPAVLQGLTSTAILSSVASVSNLFPGKEAIATGVLVGASDASTLLLPTFVVLTQKFPKITYEGLMTTMGYISASYVLIALITLPDEPYHRHRHHHHDDHEDPRERQTDKEDEKQALLNGDKCNDSLAADSIGAYNSTDADMLRAMNGQDTTDAKTNFVSITNGDFRSRFASVQSAPGNIWRRSSTNDRRSHSYSGFREKVKLTELSLNQQVTHPLFVCFVGVWALHALRVCLYMDLNEIFFSYLGDDQLLTRAYSWMLPVGAVFSVISGVICQRCGVKKALLYQTIVSVLISAVCCIPVLAAQWVSMVLFLVLSGSIWTIAVGYMAEIFGYAHFGMMMGILSVSVGVVNQTIGGAALHLVLSQGPVCCYYVNAVQLILGLVSIVGNVHIIRHDGCEVEKEVSRKVHFGVDDDCPRVSYFYSGKIQSMMPAICFSDTDSESSC